MQTVITSPHILLSEALKDYLLARVKRLDLRYGDHIRDVKVDLFDIDGPKGSVDLVCRIQTQFDHHPSVNTEGRNADPYIAILLATHRMERTIRPILDAPGNRDPEPYRNARTKRNETS